MFNTVIWATDASEAAEAALPFARELVQESGGTLVVVYSNDADELGLEARIQLQVHELREAGIDAIFKLVSGTAGEPAHAIADVASAFERRRDRGRHSRSRPRRGRRRRQRDAAAAESRSLPRARRSTGDAVARELDSDAGCRDGLRALDAAGAVCARGVGARPCALSVRR